jgi:4-oxalocrotonate tautomerase
MPLVQIKGIQNYLDSRQKEELIKKVTEAVVSVEGEAIRQVTWVLVEDVPEGAWGVAGNPVTAQTLRDL